MEGFLVTDDIRKFFDSLSHKPLLKTLEKYGKNKNHAL